MQEIIFKHDPNDAYPWNAYNRAEDWARANGYSVGAMESGSPTALFKGDFAVSKWKNLGPEERRSADGTIEAFGSNRFRDSDVIVKLSGNRAEVSK